MIEKGDLIRVLNAKLVEVHGPESEELNSLLQACVGQTFEVLDVCENDFAGETLISYECEVGEALGKKSWEHTVWFDPTEVEKV